MITDVPGVLVGHWTDHDARTGCTVVRFPEGTVASGEVRGGAPATREFALLDPVRLVSEVHAVVLSGGSAFGLAAGDGVMGVLESEGVGFDAPAGPVPIVVGMSLYDLSVGDGAVRPTAASGREAAEAATTPGVIERSLGAGCGATVGKWAGRSEATAGGLVTATVRSGDVVVSALLAANPIGWIDDGTRTDVLPAPAGRPPADDAEPTAAQETDPAPGMNTTIGVVVTNAALSKLDAHRCAQAAHDGFARALYPSHTMSDGDAVVMAATGAVELGPAPSVGLAELRVMTTAVVTDALRSLP